MSMDLHVELTVSEEFEKHRFDYLTFLANITLNDRESPALKNMGDQESSGFLHIVDQKTRWTKETGQIALLYDGPLLVGISAVEQSTLHAECGSGGNRCWLMGRYRKDNEVTRYLLNSNLDWCRIQGKAGMILTFNDYNKWIYDTILKLSERRGATLGKVWSPWWNDCVALPRKVRLFNTPQWAVVKPILKRNHIDKLISEIDDNYGVRNKPFVTT